MTCGGTSRPYSGITALLAIHSAASITLVSRAGLHPDDIAGICAYLDPKHSGFIRWACLGVSDSLDAARASVHISCHARIALLHGNFLTNQCPYILYMHNRYVGRYPLATHPMHTQKHSQVALPMHAPQNKQNKHREQILKKTRERSRGMLWRHWLLSIGSMHLSVLPPT